jgi:hypothetical protein
MEYPRGGEREFVDRGCDPRQRIAQRFRTNFEMSGRVFEAARARTDIAGPLSCGRAST